MGLIEELDFHIKGMIAASSSGDEEGARGHARVANEKAKKAKEAEQEAAMNRYEEQLAKARVMHQKAQYSKETFDADVKAQGRRAKALGVASVASIALAATVSWIFIFTFVIAGILAIVLAHGRGDTVLKARKANLHLIDTRHEVELAEMKYNEAVIKRYDGTN